VLKASIYYRQPPGADRKMILWRHCFALGCAAVSLSQWILDLRSGPTRSGVHPLQTIDIIPVDRLRYPRPCQGPRQVGVTIGYSDRFRLRPRDTLPRACRGQGAPTGLITSPLSIAPHDLGLSEGQRQIVSCRVRQLVGGAGESSNRGALENGGARKPAAHKWGRRCTRSRDCRPCPS
jgi:hypothetical protein